MSTVIRPELSVKNKYWIDKHRYYELKHFCLQYPIWKKARATLDGFSQHPTDSVSVSKTNVVCDPTEKCAEIKLYYSQRIEMIERIAEEVDTELGKYILEAVTEGISYSQLKARTNIPCCKDVYYDLYRRFFWLLNRARR